MKVAIELKELLALARELDAVAVRRALDDFIGGRGGETLGAIQKIIAELSLGMGRTPGRNARSLLHQLRDDQGSIFTGSFADAVSSPASWPLLAHLISWVKQYEGDQGEFIEDVFECCPQSYRYPRFRRQDAIDAHLEIHRRPIRSAVMGIAAGDRIGLTTHILLSMGKASQEGCRGLEQVREYQEWLDTASQELGQSLPPNSTDSSLGACLATVVALDPTTKMENLAGSLAGDLANAIGCGTGATDAAIITATICQSVMLKKRWDWNTDWLKDCHPGIVLAATGKMPDKVAGFRMHPSNREAQALDSSVDRADIVLEAARYFEDISETPHTGLNRLFKWAEGAHPAGIIAGFHLGVKYEVDDNLSSEFFSHIESERLEILKSVAHTLAETWVPPFA